MSEQNTSPHEAKVLADLLALALGDSTPQAEAAMEAIRRRAARDGVTGGALKALAHRLLVEVRPNGLAAQSADLEAAVANLNWQVEDQRRELEETRRARQLTEHAMSDTRRTNASLADRIGGLDRARKGALAMGFGLGLACAVAGYFSFGLLRHVHIGAPLPNGVPGQGAHLNRAAQSELDDFLHNCFLASINSLGTGSSFDMHLLLDIDADGRIITARAASDQTASNQAGPDQTRSDQTGSGDQDKRQYSEMLLRTLSSGSCGKLPLPASLQGKANHLDLWLSR